METEGEQKKKFLSAFMTNIFSISKVYGLVHIFFLSIPDEIAKSEIRGRVSK
jgi:hypothetical protein